MPLIVSDERKPPRKHTTIGICRQQLPGAAQALDAAIPGNFEGTTGAICEGRRLLFAAVNPM
jgi:hypothetical protein